eukprot:bmy_22121T0
MVNKMSLHNLAMVSSPTLLWALRKESKLPAKPASPSLLQNSWSLEVMSLVQVLLYFLHLEVIPCSKQQETEYLILHQSLKALVKTPNPSLRFSQNSLETWQNGPTAEQELNLPED